jgi:hypothetical protein
MKRFLLLVFLLITAFAWSACNGEDKKNDELTTTEIPAVVQSAFTSKYPAASETKWERGKENGKSTYKVKFMSDQKKIKAEFGEDGKFIKDEVEEDK